MPYQKPRADHPWRTGIRPGYEPKEEKVKPKIKPVRILIKEISTSWDTIEITTYAYGKEGRYKLGELPETRQAAWLAGLLKRNYDEI